MSILERRLTQYTPKCDGCKIILNSYICDKISARKIMKYRGWKSVGTKDYCPDCAAKREIGLDNANSEE